MLKNGGAGRVNWNERCRDLPICRSVNHCGDVHYTKLMTEDTFIDMFKTFFMQAGYRDVPGSIHMIRREVGKQIDKLYTEVERSQQLTQADKAVFGQSYTADISSCDGMSAFLREKPDHRAVDYFQGLAQFRQEGLPIRLPTALKEDINRDAELLAWDQKIAQADESTCKKAKQKRQKVLERLEKRKLEEYRQECSSRLMRENLFNDQQATIADPHPIHKLRPEIGRLAEKMTRTSPSSQQDKVDAMHDMRLLLAAPPIFYREHEEPKNGRCPYCSIEMHSIMDKRSRCKHIHRCRKRAVAQERGVLPGTLKFCYFCNLFFTAEEYSDHCKMHLTEPLGYCGSVTYRHTLVRPAFCLLCRQSKRRTPATRMYFWERDIDAIRHMETEHKDEWPWSCPGCNFSGENNKACYHHLHDAHGYELVTEQKQGVYRNSTGSPPVLQSHEPMDQSTPSGTDVKPADPPLSSLRGSGRREEESSEVGIVNDSLATPNCLGSFIVPSTANLDLASTAESSLALLRACSWGSLEPNEDPPATKASACDGQYNGVQNLSAGPMAIDTDSIGSGSQCALSPLPTPCTPDDSTGSATSDIHVSGCRKRRIKLATGICRPEADDIESLPALKKRRIILKIRPRRVGEKGHAGGDGTVIQTRVKPPSEKIEINNLTKTRIILKTGSCRPDSRRLTTPFKTWQSDTTSFRRKWTLEEDETVCRMKKDKYSWTEIQRALPHRSQGSIQVRYSTQLKQVDEG
ncbi:uncharacterized protein FMAN_07348 [Fusarium mangiferae]|uniref:Myb-like domain-containing protein n=1 Tax=Fusarium mangiferae TaxID=192010 RepID=A0A1L7T6V6_FUSMA|nr:uncharacterized protein FMAN_07348 [Fusarium mangiferae]CVK92452.1 uncharacterized protein FMAN_07348 [Fusarium mangiferae]